MVEETPDQKVSHYALLAKDTVLGLANADALRGLRLEAEGEPQSARDIYALADKLGLVKECHGYLGRSTYVTPNLSIKGSGDRKGFGSARIWKETVPFGGINWPHGFDTDYSVGISRMANMISSATTGVRICSEVEEWGYAGLGPFFVRNFVRKNGELGLCNLLVYSRSDGPRKPRPDGEDSRAMLRLLRGALLNRIFGWDTLSTRNVCIHEGERGKEALMADLETLRINEASVRVDLSDGLGRRDVQVSGRTLSRFMEDVQPGLLQAMERPQTLEDLLGLELSPAASPEGYTAEQKALITSGGEIPLSEAILEALNVQAEQLAACRADIADILTSVAERADWENHRERMPATLEGMLALVQKVLARRGEGTDIVLDHTAYGPDSPYAEALRSLPVKSPALRREMNAGDILWALYAGGSSGPLYDVQMHIGEVDRGWKDKRVSPLYAHIQYCLATAAHMRQKQERESRVVMSASADEEADEVQLPASIEKQIASLMGSLPGAEREKRLTFEFPERHLTLELSQGELRATASGYLNAPQRAVRSLKRRIVKKRAPKRYVTESVEELGFTSLNRCAYGAMVACEALKTGLIGMPPDGKFVLRG